MAKEYEQQKFSAIYTSESDAVFRYFLFRVSDREVSLDLTQEAFMRLWDTLSSGATLKSERAFLFTIARNLVIDWYRRKKPVSLDALNEKKGEEPGVGEEGQVFETLMLGAEGRHVFREIQKLPRQYKEVILLRFVEGLQPKDIAEILQESINVISVRITRGIRKLRTITGYSKETIADSETLKES